MDIFISKLDVNGDFVWAKHVGGSSEEAGAAIAFDVNNNVILTGHFWGTVDFDPGVATNNITSNGGSDAFVLKLDENGVFQSIMNLGGNGNEYGLSLTLDGTSHFYLAGLFSESMNIDPLGTVNNISSNGSSDLFVAKYDQNSELIWGYGFGAADADAARDISIDNDNNVYATGYFRGTVDFDPGSNVEELTSEGNSDIFVWKLNELGEFEWAYNFGSTDGDIGFSIEVSGSNIFVVGDYSGTIDFDPSLNNYPLTSEGSKDIFTLNLGCLSTNGTDVQSTCDSYTWIDGNTYTSSNNTATHTLTNAAGCDSVVTLDLTIQNVNTTVNQNENILVADISGATYQWIDCDDNNVVIVGATSQTYTATENGSYAVIITDENCSDTSNCYEISTIGLSISNLNENVTIYPNPTAGIVHIKSNEGYNPVSVHLRNSLGQLVFSKFEISNQIMTIEIEGETGIYFVEVISDSGIKSVVKLVKK